MPQICGLEPSGKCGDQGGRAGSATRDHVRQFDGGTCGPGQAYRQAQSNCVAGGAHLRKHCSQFYLWDRKKLDCRLIFKGERDWLILLYLNTLKYLKGLTYI